MSDLISLCNNLSAELDTLRVRLAECERGLLATPHEPEPRSFVEADRG